VQYYCFSHAARARENRDFIFRLGQVDFKYRLQIIANEKCIDLLIN